MSMSGRVTRASKSAKQDVEVKEEPTTPEKLPRTPRKKRAVSSAESPSAKKTKKIQAGKVEPDEAHPIQPEPATAPSPKPLPAAAAEVLQARKLKSYTQHGAKQSPFPSFARPTPADCALAHRILASLHGEPGRPRGGPAAAPADRAGCGDSPSVLDALVRTILSQNTSDTNSARAKRSMDAAYGRSDAWAAIAAGGRARLQETIRCGGLSAVKSRVILAVLEQVKARYGTYSLDHLHAASSEDAMREMLSFQGVGPKTASCVLLFCLGRDSFAVDTHVWRLTGLLGWRPAKASRDETHLHLDARTPDHEKYPLHVLLIAHGKRCDECKAGGKKTGKCELRKAFRQAKPEDEVVDEGPKEVAVD